jgi:hypothetical protein
MRATIALLLLCLSVSAHAREWKSELFHCAANVPESAGWQEIEVPHIPGLAPVLAMQHAAKQAVFGINVVEKFRDANLADVSIQKELEAILRQFGYQFVGHSSVKTGGLDWLQYPVRAGAGAQQVSGVIRFTSAGGYVFGITLLRGGGQEASQDVELQQAAASFRILPAPTVAAAPAPAQDSRPKVPPVPASTASVDKETQKKAAEISEEPPAEDGSRARMIWYAAGGLIVLLVFFSIIGGGKSKKR